MAKKNTEDTNNESTSKRGGNGNKNTKKVELKEEARYNIWGIGFIIFGIIMVLSIFEMAGIVGSFIFRALHSLLGFGYYLLPILLVVVGVSFLKKQRPQIARFHTIFGLITLITSLGLLDIASNGNGESLNITYGGFLGGIISWPFIKLFGLYGGILILGGGLIISLIVLFNESPNLPENFEKIWNFLKRDLWSWRKKSDNPDDQYSADNYEIEEPEKQEDARGNNRSEKIISSVAYDESPVKEEKIKDMPELKKRESDYVPPPLELLEGDRGKANTGDTKGNVNIIQRTLLTFGISVEMDEVTIGPTVTRYALKPAQGVKLSRIVGLQNELALALSAKSIRIEAPIPGKSLVGIEVPNKQKSTVGLANLLGDDRFKKNPKPLTVALGRGLSGAAVFGDLAKMPHLLVAGTTGSGKSVSIHSIITSLLYRNGPLDMRFFLVDPKRVELTLYNKIPHLLAPVITDPKKTILALKWATREMERRYEILQDHAVQNIESYHENIYLKAQKKGDTTIERMPYIVIVIDELADIMQTYPRELESAIVRLAQMSRAVGIHLILSTQRPSVNVITGLIKANIPARIALQVSSQVDSRTILDQSGAEKLLGAGDMLYLSTSSPNPERLQSAFISEEEVKRVVNYLKQSYIDEIPDTVELTGNIEKGSSLFSDSLDDESGDDDLYEDARMVVIEAGKASTSFLQRKLGVGYARAAKLIDMLEARHVVGPGNGAKPRDVLEKPIDNTGDL